MCLNGILDRRETANYVLTMPKSLSTLILPVLLLSLISCQKGGGDVLKQQTFANKEREVIARRGVNSISSMNTQDKAEVMSKFEPEGFAQVALLYFKDNPSHREAIVAWLEEHQCEIGYESKRFGYIDAKVSWGNIAKLVQSVGKLSFADESFYKLEVQFTKEAKKDEKKKSHLAHLPQEAHNELFSGPVHEAGYGIKLEEFKAEAAKWTGLAETQINGTGTSVAIYDSGLNLADQRIFQNRLKDIYVGIESAWFKASLNEEKFQEATKKEREARQKREKEAKAKEGKTKDEKANNDEEKVAEVEEEIENDDESTSENNQAAAQELKYVVLKEENDFGGDLNGNGSYKDTLIFLLAEEDSKPYVQLYQVKSNQLSEVKIYDYKLKNQVLDLETGKLRHDKSQNTLAFKFRKVKDTWEVAPVGGSIRASHGNSNLHMVAGKYQTKDKDVSYNGIAYNTSINFAQTWEMGGFHYGSKWIPLARTMLMAAEKNVDVIDLDIYTPGNRFYNSLLSQVLCRIVENSNSVPVVAAHNYGPLSNTVQNMAQSPCVLAVGAGVTRAAYEDAYQRGNISDDLKNKANNFAVTIPYSGRGFAMNGLLKPDIITPTYAYTSRGDGIFYRFGGTSAATPATAGFIAVFKQVARKMGIELNFSQVKFLLQAGSRRPDSTYRDGYGHLNALNSLKILQSQYNAQTKTVNNFPFSLKGNQNIQLKSRPDHKSYAISLSRDEMSLDHNHPVSMTFWVEYLHANGLEKNWIRVADHSGSNFSQKAVFEVPMLDQSTRYTFDVHISQNKWDALPPGDYTAVIKGVRSDLATDNNRAVDYLQPISITKGREAKPFTKITLNKLFQENFQYEYVKVKPGERLKITGSVTCTKPTGKKLPAALSIRANPYSFISHASNQSNGYADYYLDQGSSVEIDVENNLVELVFINRTCSGLLEGELLIERKFGTIEYNVSKITETKDNKNIEAQIRFKVDEDITNEPSFSRNSTTGYEVDKDNIRVVVNLPVKSSCEIQTLKSFEKVRFAEQKNSKFPGFLVSESAISDDNLIYNSGFNSNEILGSAGYEGSQLSSSQIADNVFFVQLVSKQAMLTMFHNPDANVSCSVNWTNLNCKVKNSFEDKLREMYPEATLSLLVPVMLVREQSTQFKQVSFAKSIESNKLIKLAF